MKQLKQHNQINNPDKKTKSEKDTKQLKTILMKQEGIYWCVI